MSNTIGFLGRLTADAEGRAVGSNTVTSFTVASDVGYGDRASTNFFRCSYWRKAEGLMPYLKKGQQVFISGEFSSREWTTAEGQTRTSIEVNVNNITLAGSNSAANQAPQPQAAQSVGTPVVLDDDLTF